MKNNNEQQLIQDTLLSLDNITTKQLDLKETISMLKKTIRSIQTIHNKTLEDHDRLYNNYQFVCQQNKKLVNGLESWRCVSITQTIIAILFIILYLV